MELSPGDRTVIASSLLYLSSLFRDDLRIRGTCWGCVAVCGVTEHIVEMMKSNERWWPLRLMCRMLISPTTMWCRLRVPLRQQCANVQRPPGALRLQQRQDKPLHLVVHDAPHQLHGKPGAAHVRPPTTTRYLSQGPSVARGMGTAEVNFDGRERYFLFPPRAFNQPNTVYPCLTANKHA